MLFSDWSSDVGSSDLVRQQDVPDLVPPGHGVGRSGECAVDGPDFASVEVLWSEPSDVGDGLFHPVPVLDEILLLVVEPGGVVPGQAGKAVLRVVTGDLDLPAQRQHVGGQPRLQQFAFHEPVLVHGLLDALQRSDEHTSELQSLMRISYAVFCLKKKKKTQKLTPNTYINNHTY